MFRKLITVSILLNLCLSVGLAVSASDGKTEGGKAVSREKTDRKTEAVQKGFRVIQTSGSRYRISLSFNRDLGVEQARRPANYEISPKDVKELRVVAIGKFVTLSGLKLTKGKKYRIKIAEAVKDLGGRSLAEANRTVEFTPVYEKRKVRISAIQPLKKSEWTKHYSTGEKGILGYLDYVVEMVNEAGEMGSDIVCLPEAIPITSRFERSRFIPGPYFNTLAKQAKKHSMYVIAHMMEKQEKLLKEKGPNARRSTAFIIDRQGKLLGKYYKVHLTEGGGLKVQAGDTFPVFQTDFGKIGIQICFDIIAFSESIRLLALNGAEIVFFPHATGSNIERDIMLRARGMAIENCLYIVPCHYGRIMSDPASGSSRWFGRTCVIGPNSFVLADTGSDPGIASAVIDLEKKRLGSGWGTGGVNDVRYRIFKHRRPSIYGGLTKEKKEK